MALTRLQAIAAAAVAALALAGCGGSSTPAKHTTSTTTTTSSASRTAVLNSQQVRDQLCPQIVDAATNLGSDVQLQAHGPGGLRYSWLIAHDTQRLNGYLLQLADAIEPPLGSRFRTDAGQLVGVDGQDPDLAGLQLSKSPLSGLAGDLRRVCPAGSGT